MPDNRIALLPGKYYHIYNHANGNENLFRQDENYHYFLQQYAHHINAVADTFAYCLMPNHFHFFIRLKEKHTPLPPLEGHRPGVEVLQGVEKDAINQYFSRKFSNLCNGYTQAYNIRFERKGSLFIPRFKRKEVDSIEYSCNLIRYIHQNPVLHGFVKHPENWPFSSYNSHLSVSPSKLCRNEVLSWFEDAANFKALHQLVIPEKFKLEIEL